ncbi:MAG: cadherin-like beta sandwich domain-containing protein [Clostridia bacterium]|nr:cadherin-like beta sandwich domain-containing protein [Clostridia bacterium]
MKKTMKSLLSLFIVIVFAVSCFAFNVSAASATISGTGEYEVGKTFNVTIRFNADATLYAVEADVSYNPSVLKFNSGSGAEFTNNNGKIKLVDDAFTNTKPSKTSSYTLNFTAIAAGNSTISASVLGGGEATSQASTSANVKVVTPKPSSNANLASIKLSNGSLSPAFNANTTNYNVTVKYDVDEINVTGSVADGKSRVAGGGTVGLQVGNNECVLTVTAEDGTKKSYIINIKRMTEEETLAAEEDARNSNPLLVVIDGADYTIVNDLKDITIPTGFTQGTATRKESEITVLNDVSGKYQLCWLVDQNGENGAWYKRDENDNFKRLAYIVANDVMYIVESIDGGSALPSGFVRADFTLDGQTVDTIKYKNEALGDFCIFNCYVAGKTENEYYRYDTIEGTMQRATDFVAAKSGAIVDQPADSQQTTTSDEKSWFDSMTKTGKMVFFLIIFIALILVVIGVLIIVKIVSPKRDNDDEDEETEEDIE